MEQKLRLNEFKTLYKAWGRGIPWWDHLLLGLLVWLETKLIDYRVESTVSEAIEEYEAVEEQPESLVKGIYSETGSNFFDEMRITASFSDKNT